MIRVVISISCGWQGSSEIENKPNTQPVLGLGANVFSLEKQDFFFLVNSLISFSLSCLTVRIPVVLQDSHLPRSRASAWQGLLMCPHWGPPSQGSKGWCLTRALLNPVLPSAPVCHLYGFVQGRSTQPAWETGQHKTFFFPSVAQKSWTLLLSSSVRWWMQEPAHESLIWMDLT